MLRGVTIALSLSLSPQGLHSRTTWYVPRRESLSFLAPQLSDSVICCFHLARAIKKLDAHAQCSLFLFVPLIGEFSSKSSSDLHLMPL